MTWAASGKRCVCVVDTFFAVVTDTKPQIRKGDVLVIREVIVDPVMPNGWPYPGVFVNFVGHNPDAVYNVGGFRPVVEKDEAEDVAAFLYLACHIDPLQFAGEYEESFREIEEALDRYDLL